MSDYIKGIRNPSNAMIEEKNRSDTFISVDDTDTEQNETLRTGDDEDKTMHDCAAGGTGVLEEVVFQEKNDAKPKSNEVEEKDDDVRNTRENREENGEDADIVLEI